MNKAFANVVEATHENFAGLIDRSHQVPVVIDFWAPWCQPCRLLGPMLEKLADEYQGRFQLVKADIEELPDIAGQFGVQSIPAVFGLRDGKIVDQFLGLLPEPELRLWLDRLMPTPAETLVAEARRLAQEDPAAAEARFRQALELAPQDSAAQFGLADVLLKQHRVDEARRQIEELERRGFLEPEAQRLKAAVELEGMKTAGGDLEALRARAAAAPDDLQLQFELAQALAGAGQYEAALDLALQLVQRDRKQFGERARQLMVDLFRVLPEGSELTNTYRRKLSTALY
jgi:putative thioredoxin